MANSYRYIFTWHDVDGDYVTKTITAVEELTNATDTNLRAAAGNVLTTVLTEQPFNTTLAGYDTVAYKSTKYTNVL